MLISLLDLVLIPLFISVTSQVIAEWLIRKYTDKRDKKQQPECLHRNRHKKPLGLPSQWFYNALGYSTLSHYDCNTLQGICHIKRNNPLVITNRISHRSLRWCEVYKTLKIKYNSSPSINLNLLASLNEEGLHPLPIGGLQAFPADVFSFREYETTSPIKAFNSQSMK